MVGLGVFQNVLTRARFWHLIDARGLFVGKLAAIIAPILQGKHKPVYTPGIDCGDYVVVINGRYIEFSGRKWKQKVYRWHTGYIGNLQTRTAEQVLERNPERILEKAVYGMLPKNHLRKEYWKRLRVYPDETHLHESQIAAFTWPGASPFNIEKARPRASTDVPWTQDDLLIELQADEEEFRMLARNLTPEDAKLLPPNTPHNISATIRPKRSRAFFSKK